MRIKENVRKKIKDLLYIDIILGPRDIEKLEESHILYITYAKLCSVIP